MRRQDPRRRQGPHPQPRHRGSGPVGAVDQGRAGRGGLAHGRPPEAAPPPQEGHRQERRSPPPQAAAAHRQGRQGCRREGSRRLGAAAPPQPPSAAAGLPVRRRPGAARRRRLGPAAASCRGLRRLPVGRRAAAAAGGVPVVLRPLRRVPGGHRRRMGRVRVPTGRSRSLRRRVALLIDRSGPSLKQSSLLLLRVHSLMMLGSELRLPSSFSCRE